MLNRIRSIMLVTLAVGLMWGCGGERGMESSGVEEQIGRPLSKMAVAGGAMSQTMVVATVSQDDAPVAGVMVEFARSIAGQIPDYQWSGMTDDMGRVTLEISGQVSGYYQARASQDGSVMGRWSSIPINGGYTSTVALPIGGMAQVTGTSKLISVGLVVSKTGRLSETGQGFINGFEMALEEVNSQLSDVSLRFIVEDDQSTIEGATAAYNRLIHEDGVPVILGVYTSTMVRAVFPIAQENEVVAISPTSAARGLSAIGDFVFRVALTVDSLIPGSVKLTREKLGYERVATMFQNMDVFSQSSDEVLKSAFSENGVEVLATETFETGAMDLSEQFSRIVALNPDAIFVSAISVGRTQALIDGGQHGIPILMPLLTMDEVERAGEAAEGAISFTYWSSTGNVPANRAFVENYMAKYGAEPGRFAAVSYATVHILAKAIADAQSSDPRAIRDALAQIENLDTVLGAFSFDANGDAVYDPAVLIVKDGKFEVFDTKTAMIATATIGETNESGVAGKAVFTQIGDNIKLVVSLANASAGEHAVHIHATGDCSAPDGTSAGGHWNPTGVAHGKWGEGEFHLGDIGNLMVDDQGMGKIVLTTNLWEMNTGSDIDIVGKAIIVHAGADDFVSQPSGNAGARIGCGVIELG
ncbi:MAG: ABC transporter substrate-binding protein, partial [Gemmatimonadota bacterium]|nr:ABC transporter substrate-binding protein [Gemmatimonadota bacterium]